MVKRFVVLWLVLMLVAGGALSESLDKRPAEAATYDGRWVRVTDSAMEIYLPAAWTIASEKEVPAGLLAEDPETKFAMRLSLSPNEGRTTAELLDTFQQDARYQNAKLVSLGQYQVLLADEKDGGALVGVADSEYVGMTFTFTFSPIDAEASRKLAEDIMGTLRVFTEGNG